MGMLFNHRSLSKIRAIRREVASKGHHIKNSRHPQGSGQQLGMTTEGFAPSAGKWHPKGIISKFAGSY
jgi:hypothetical protein